MKTPTDEEYQVWSQQLPQDDQIDSAIRNVQTEVALEINKVSSYETSQFNNVQN